MKSPENRKKCIFCYPRLEKGEVNACAEQCPGRLRFVGLLDCSWSLRSSTASRIGTPHHINNPTPMALSQVRWAHGRRGTIHRGATPTPFSTTPGQGCMNSLVHNRTRYVFRAPRRSVSPFHPDIFFLSLPRSISAIDSSTRLGPVHSFLLRPS